MPACDREAVSAIEPGMNSIPAGPLLSLSHVTVMRGDRAALHDINLEIACGEHVCILGPNGCCKSTLIKTVTRECYPLAREGSCISILGRERWDIFELRSLLGIVSPDLLAPVPRMPPAVMWCSRVSSAARAFFRTIIPIQDILHGQRKLWRGLALGISRIARSP